MSLAGMSREEQMFALHEKLFPPTTHSWVQITEIEPDIYLGGIPSPRSDDENQQNGDRYEAPHSILLEFGIKTIISFSDFEVWWHFNPEITYVHFVILDCSGNKLLHYFSLIYTRIEEARKRGDKIFIHCHAGISRSVTALAAYYLRKGLPHKPTPSMVEVVRFLQSKRPFIRPNIGFLMQLLYYEVALENERQLENSKNST